MFRCVNRVTILRIATSIQDIQASSQSYSPFKGRLSTTGLRKIASITMSDRPPRQRILASASGSCSSTPPQLDVDQSKGLAANPLSSSYSTKTENQRVARPDEVNYALIQDMGTGYTRHSVQISALGTTYNMVYGEWVNVGLSRPDSPVVLCVHGTPATEGAFRPIGSLIAAQGFRVLAVNFPGMGHTKTDAEGRYDYITAHKVELIKGFLSALQIDSIATVIGHSLGSHIVASLAADEELEGRVASACFLCGTGVTPHRMLKMITAIPYLPKLIYKGLYIPVVGPILSYVFSKIVYMVGFRGRTPESQVLSIYEAYLMDFDEHRKNLTRIGEKELPTIVFYGRKDTIVEPELISEAVDVLRIPENNAKDYDEDGKSQFIFPDTVLQRVVSFANGAHRLQFSHTKQTSAEIVSFLGALKSRL